MSNYFKTSALAAILALSVGSANATDNFATSATMTLKLTTVDAISVSVDDITIDNIVGGDSITVTHAISTQRDPHRTTTCSIPDSMTLANTSGDSTFDLDTEISDEALDCGTLTISGDIPASVNAGETYTANLTVSYAYDLSVSTFDADAVDVDGLDGTSAGGNTDQTERF